MQASPPPVTPGLQCQETCSFSADGECDDGGSGAEFSECSLGTDCIDCGYRADQSLAASPPPPNLPYLPWTAPPSTVPTSGLDDLSTLVSSFSEKVLYVGLPAGTSTQLHRTIVVPSTKTVILRSDGDAPAFLDGNRTFALVTVEPSATLLLSNVVLSYDGGVGVECGGAVHVRTQGTLKAQLTVFRANVAERGGAICAQGDDTTLALSEVVFTQNCAPPLRAPSLSLTPHTPCRLHASLDAPPKWAPPSLVALGVLIVRIRLTDSWCALFLAQTLPRPTAVWTSTWAIGIVPSTRWAFHRTHRCRR